MSVNKSIRDKFVGYFVLYAIGIFIILWLLQIFFLQACYKLMLKSEVVRIGNKIKESLESEDVLDEISFKNSFSILIVGENGNIEYSSTDKDTKSYIDFNLAKENLAKSSKDYAAYTVNIPKLDSGVVIYISKVGNYYILVTSVIEPLSATARVLSTQLVYITAILIILSVLISSTISSQLVKPVEKITKKAKELGKR